MPLMVEPEPWRKTGRKAKEDHWLGLCDGALVELAVYDDRGNGQGRLVAQLSSKGDAGAHDEGEVWMSKILAVEDPYFDWWVDTTYPDHRAALHACARQAGRCTVGTLYRNALHMDVFRLLPGRSAMSLKWPSDDEKARIEAVINAFSPPEKAPGDPSSGGNLGKRGGEVAAGAEGIEGLAGALGTEMRAEGGNQAPCDEPRKRKHPEKPKKKESGERREGLEAVLQGRKAAAPELSALKLPQKSKGEKKKKKRKQRSRRKEKEESQGSSTSSSSSGGSSTEESVFRLAALPKGVDKLQRLHQERPGVLANLTLKRFSELLSRSVGGGTADSASDLPAVARAYLTQIYLVKSPETQIGLRNLRELRTLAMMVDYMASNDTLRAMDVAVQRMKSIEVFVAQGNWTQASLLELIPAEGEQRAWFRQELKAAQQEAKLESRMTQDQWTRRRRAWEPATGAGAPSNDEMKTEGEKGDAPPHNGPRVRKGKGKGKKGKRW